MSASLEEKHLRRQAAREKRKLLERERDACLSPTAERRYPPGRASAQRARVRDPYQKCLDRPKNLSGRALAGARELVRVCRPYGTIRKWVERSEVDALLDAGWLLEDPA